VLVAEVMLAQTQVDRVVPRWEALLDRWPDAPSLAGTALGDLLAFWQGLGYPRRAANLHRAATRIVEAHDGTVPAELDALVALPGVGGYTARAVMAFAHELDVGVVDTNIARVLARHGGARLTPTAAQRLADEWVPSGRGWRWNQALMDVGALHCRPAPRCDGCPFAPTCSWSLAGRSSPDPAERSAHVSRRQAPYAGSVRQARGRALAALGAGPMTAEDLAAVASVAVVEGLVADGLVSRDGDRYRLG
jgi:A/G-specific adenine glycosylase